MKTHWPAIVVWTAICLTAGFSAQSLAVEVDPLDWPNWRGPEQNGISREKGLVESFDPSSGENLLWKNEEAAGISTPIIMRGKLYTIVRDQPETRHEREKVLCLDAVTGKKLWERAHNVYLSDVPAERVGWSNIVGDPTTGRVYAQGVNGFFQCLDGDTGKEIWSRSMHEEFGLLSTYGGRTNTPVIFEDMVLASAVIIGWGDTALPAHRFLGMDKNTGEVRWLNGTTVRPEDTTYSTPVLTVLGGEAAMVFGSSDGACWAFQPRTGQPIWNYKMSRRGISVSPVVEGDTVYMTQAEENLDNRGMGSIAAIKGIGNGDITKTNTLWNVKEVTAGKGSPVLLDGRLYVVDDSANLHIFDAKTGKRVGKRPTKLVGTMNSASLTAGDGKIYAMSTGAFQIMEPTATGVKFLHKGRLDAGDIIIGSPVISHGRVYLPTPNALYCLGTKDQQPSADPRPALPKETPAGNDDQPATVQVVPAEVLLAPGQTQTFKVRLFNDRGQFLKESSAEYSLQGTGKIDNQGTFTAALGTNHSATTVTAKVGELQGKARIRVVPPLPWKFDFNDIHLAKDAKSGRDEGEPPVTWVGARYRHKVRDVDGERVMVKVTYIPKGTRSQSWFGPTDLHDYTIQADLRANKAGKLPDMGLIAQRYTLDMMGESQQLQIRSWTPQVATNFSKTVPLNWEADKWYTLKFSAGVKDGKAVLQGKVWPRGTQEPAEWTVSATDDLPNLHGSPGLFGNATNAEIYIDNISVTDNGNASSPAGRSAAK
ncbi:MAG: PQQ-binding-like beta-propeller repeat protein [Planctomycetota bacterium]|nr:PQQ-binding-like beta-propeller repeat protein [Planctomycetota bacterium]